MNKFYNEFQEDFISNYNELHELLVELAIPYYQRISDGTKYNSKITPSAADDYLENDFKRFMPSVYGVIDDNDFIRRRLTDLHKVNELRNLIVHQYNKNNQDGYKIVNIAQPTEYSLNLLTELIAKLKNPITIKDYLIKESNNKVTSMNSSDHIYDLFKIIKDNKFTQFPVFENNKYKGIVSSNGITLRLAETALAEKDYGSLELFDLKVSDFLKVDELKDAYVIVNSSDYLYTILKYFELNEETKQIPVILVISDESSKDNFTPKSLVGILNSYDYLDIYKEAISRLSF